MSGHSHARTVKHTKDLAAAQRSKAFSKLAVEITVAVKQGGGNPNTNARLRTAMERAKAANMPSDNVERAIKKGAGEGQAENLEEFLLEAYGPGGIAMLVAGITDNKNRMLSDLKQILAKNQGKMVDGGAVRWLFEQKGVITTSPKSDLPALATPKALQAGVQNPKQKEDLELMLIEAGAEDLYWREDGMLDIYTKPADLEKVKNNLQAAGISVEESSIDWVPKEEVAVDQKTADSAQKLFDELDENDAVQGIYSNLKG
ncbi:MAG: YebC/PmpR family DNA-binding transcriptional regulator [Candidatus Wildermuthbacteria bacterium]|nr:YebC/PmpR family DNA-binding transcriptional regulator [Candidatus Wildermuthbacteria bacterium]